MYFFSLVRVCVCASICSQCRYRFDDAVGGVWEKWNTNVAILNRQKQLWKQQRRPNLMYISTGYRDNIVIITGMCGVYTYTQLSKYSYRKRPSPTDPINNQYHYACLIARNSSSLLGVFPLPLRLFESSWLFRFPNFPSYDHTVWQCNRGSV